MSIFSQISRPKIKSSNFNLSFEHKLSCNFGQLVPILCEEIIPGDKFKVSTELLIKLAPLKAPMMHKVTAYVHYFFVPTFQINSVFENFINPKVNTSNSIVLPWSAPDAISSFGKIGNTLIGSLADHLGLPVTNTSWLALTRYSSLGSAHVSIDPFRAYQHIYNSYYRDQNLEVLEGANPATTSLFLIENFKGVTGDVATSITQAQRSALFKLRTRAWAKDYFTSALPSPQAGDDVLIPVTGSIVSNGEFQLQTDSGLAVDDENPVFAFNTDADGNYSLGVLDEDNNLTPGKYNSGLALGASSTTINDLRRAMALQRFKELAERGGTRYSEMVRNFFGAFLKDYWVDRPIYLGGQVQPITVSEVIQQSASGDGTIGGSLYTSYLGERGGIGNSYGRTKTISLNAPCHGYLMGILSIRPEATYSQGLERMWTRQSLYDWAFPQFAKMGEQEIYNREIYAAGDEAYDDGVFGYTPRYAEYKTGHSRISGAFRSSLNYWQLGRLFDSNNKPTLSKEFVMMDNPSYASFQVTSSGIEHCYVDLYNKVFARRPLPYFGNPSVL